MTSEHLPSAHRYRFKLDDKQIARVVKMLQERYPQVLICERFGVSKEQLRTIREQHGISYHR